MQRFRNGALDVTEKTLVFFGAPIRKFVEFKAKRNHLGISNRLLFNTSTWAHTPELSN